MKTLAINTTDYNLVVVLNDNDKLFSRVIDTGKTGHSALLMPNIDSVLKEAGLTADNIDAYAVVLGPGSFTGIRIGVSAMTAMSFAVGAKRVGVNAFELLAYNRGHCVAGIDAGHGNTYIAECEGGEVISTDFAGADDSAKVAKVDVWSQDIAPEIVLNAVVSKKIKAGEFVRVFEPVYLRKSQAERMSEVSE